MKNNSILGETVAAEMQQILATPSHQHLFAKPQIKVASEAEDCCQCKDCGATCSCKGNCKSDCKSCSNIDPKTASLRKVIVDLTKVAETFEYLGLAKSSAQTLLALNQVIKEISKPIKMAQDTLELTDDLDLPELGDVDAYLDKDSGQDSNEISDRLHKAMLDIKGVPGTKKQIKQMLQISPLNDPDLLPDDTDLESEDIGSEYSDNTEFEPTSISFERSFGDHHNPDLDFDLPDFGFETDYRPDDSPETMRLTQNVAATLKELDRWITKMSSELEENMEDTNEVEDSEEDEEDFEDEE